MFCNPMLPLICFLLVIMMAVAIGCLVVAIHELWRK